MGNGDCPFCQIVEDKIDAHILAETADALAFLDVNPVSKGHALVIPKQHAEQITDLAASDAGAVFELVRDLSAAMDEALEPNGINVLQSNGEAAGQEVPHMHAHVIPRYETDGLFFSFDAADLDDAEAHEVVDAVQNQL